MVSCHHDPDWLVPKRPMMFVRQIAIYQILALLILGKFYTFRTIWNAFRSEFGQIQNFQSVICK